MWYRQMCGIVQSDVVWYTDRCGVVQTVKCGVVYRVWYGTDSEI